MSPSTVEKTSGLPPVKTLSGSSQRAEHPHLDAEAQHRGRLLDVVRLVEDHRPRVVEVPEPQEPADEGDQARAEPPPQLVGHQ